MPENAEDVLSVALDAGAPNSCTFANSAIEPRIGGQFPKLGVGNNECGLLLALHLLAPPVGQRGCHPARATDQPVMKPRSRRWRRSAVRAGLSTHSIVSSTEDCSRFGTASVAAKRSIQGRAL
jgi:hypothetical protein